MGCDIHMVAEIKRMSSPATIISFDGQARTEHTEPSKPYWVKLGRIFFNMYYDPTAKGVWDMYKTEVLTDEPWHIRNYSLLAILAGVRNFNEIKPISEPRGVPDDCDRETTQWLEERADHSHSWLTLEELETYDWLSNPDVCEFGLVMRQLRTVARGLGLEKSDIRIVFGFDN